MLRKEHFALKQLFTLFKDLTKYLEIYISLAKIQ